MIFEPTMLQIEDFLKNLVNLINESLKEMYVIDSTVLSLSETNTNPLFMIFEN